ncbi:BrnT family toxin [Agrobacterium vaccinii]|uniref:BrnT family toxin n=1 Tax=Agrobacterium vaccinii TaxID=2735528 RepID=UPI001E61463E|nr:BrnT family toxin [Agrobacterium vaccinii]UHS57090.1 BrnT family toxin [Agrobacterium vaccinii]
MLVSKEFASFEWDENKRKANLVKHDIDLEALSEPHIELLSNRNGEVRICAICPLGRRLITVVYTMRGDICRIISARAARKNEHKL